MDLKLSHTSSSYRPTWVEISTASFKYNLSVIRKKIPRDNRLLTVVKSNAYGHGAVALSRIAVSSGSAFLGVSSVEEGIILREHGIKAPILILGSLYPFSSFRAALRYRLTPTIASGTALRKLSATGKKARTVIPFHFKVDTGMGRIGVTPAGTCEILKNIVKYPYTRLEGMYMHCASADTDTAFTRHQLALFERTHAFLKKAGVTVPICHAANSSAAARIPSSHYDMVRIGLAAYGLRSLHRSRYFDRLKPVLSWKTKIVFLKWLAKGARVSYGVTYRTKKRSLIATLPVGYADGYSRRLSNNADVLIRGRRCPVIGCVTMDMIMVDATRIKGAAIGDTVVLIGRQGKEHISTEEIARRTGTISYEVVCGISERVPRKYM